MPVTRFSRVARLSPVLRVDAVSVPVVQVPDVDVPANRMAVTFKTAAMSRAEIWFPKLDSLAVLFLWTHDMFYWVRQEGRALKSARTAMIFLLLFSCAAQHAN